MEDSECSPQVIPIRLAMEEMFRHAERGRLHEDGDCVFTSALWQLGHRTVVMNGEKARVRRDLEKIVADLVRFGARPDLCCDARLVICRNVPRVSLVLSNL